MIKVCVVGSGYVGTVVGAGLAEIGHQVVALEVDDGKREALLAGDVPFHEPGLPELVRRNLEEGRLTFTADAAQAMRDSDVVFLCVGTPSGADGQADLGALEAALAGLHAEARHHHVLITKSTVPIGTHSWIAEKLLQSDGAADGVLFTLVSNPEFLRQGSAVEDFLHPDRIVLGGDDPWALDVVEELYRPILEQSFQPTSVHGELTAEDIDLRNGAAKKPALLRTSLATAETIKYASNAFLATKISFANEMAAICDLVGADITQVVEGMGLDTRIGSQFLNAGLGWGGSCFGKDVSALTQTAQNLGHTPHVLQAVSRVNFGQRAKVVEKMEALLGSLDGAQICLLGLSFKPNTDDLRDAPSLDISRRLVRKGALVRAHDPVVTQVPDDCGIERCADPYAAAADADVVLLVTEWPEYSGLDLDRLASVMRGQFVLDGRNVLDREAIEAAGLSYVGIGRPASIAVSARARSGTST